MSDQQFPGLKSVQDFPALVSVLDIPMTNWDQIIRDLAMPFEINGASTVEEWMRRRREADAK